MKPKVDYTLYLVTDRELMSVNSVEECVEQAIAGGVTVVQLREKTASSQEFYQIALRLRALTAHHGVTLIINDRLDIAMAVDADGVHLGQDDLPYEVARGILGQDKIIGISTSTLTEAVTAASMGADYLGVGAMFATDTKSDVRLTSIDELKRIRASVKIPIVVIGGIKKSNLHCFEGTGIDGIAVVSAIVSKKDITTAAGELKLMFQNIVKE